jgi:hypothetical protein
MRLNNSDEMESITVTLSKDKTPIAWEQRVQSIVSSGATREAAEIMADEPIEVEMYYNLDAGLFLVECEAVERETIYDPYSGELLGSPLYPQKKYMK